MSVDPSSLSYEVWRDYREKKDFGLIQNICKENKVSSEDEGWAFESLSETTEKKAGQKYFI